LRIAEGANTLSRSQYRKRPHAQKVLKKLKGLCKEEEVGKIKEVWGDEGNLSEKSTREKPFHLIVMEYDTNIGTQKK